MPVLIANSVDPDQMPIYRTLGTNGLSNACSCVVYNDTETNTNANGFIGIKHIPLNNTKGNITSSWIRLIAHTWSAILHSSA